VRPAPRTSRPGVGGRRPWRRVGGEIAESGPRCHAVSDGVSGERDESGTRHHAAAPRSTARTAQDGRLPARGSTIPPGGHHPPLIPPHRHGPVSPRRLHRQLPTDTRIIRVGVRPSWVLLYVRVDRARDPTGVHSTRLVMAAAPGQRACRLREECGSARRPPRSSGRAEQCRRRCEPIRLRRARASRLRSPPWPGSPEAGGWPCPASGVVQHIAPAMNMRKRVLRRF
jgi:hypothetical protein